MKKARNAVFRNGDRFQLVTLSKYTFNLAGNPYSSINDELIYIFVIVIVLSFIVGLVMMGILLKLSEMK